jgi:hypothetical protein
MKRLVWLVLWIAGCGARDCTPTADPWFFYELQIATPGGMEWELVDATTPALVVHNRGALPLLVGEREVAPGQAERLSGREVSELLGFELQQVRADQRPQDVVIPPPRPVLIPVFQGTQEHLLPGQWSWKLNPAYRPTQMEDTQAQCRRSGQVWWVLGLVLATGLLGWGVWRGWKGA